MRLVTRRELPPARLLVIVTNGSLAPRRRAASANNIDLASDSLRTTLNRLLTQAQTALSGTDVAVGEPSDEHAISGVA